MKHLQIKEIRKELGVSQEKFAEMVGVSARTVQNWEQTPEMISGSTKKLIATLIENHRAIKGEIKEQTYFGGEKDGDTITLPLIPLDALAGKPGWDNAGVSLADCERYTVPEFSCRGAEYLIRVSGDSMFPRYNNGDILACKMLSSVTFIQWGKVYVIDTEQGILVKHLFPSKDCADNIVCHSVNTDNYPDFEIPKVEIRSFSLVVGMIAVE